MPVRLATHEEPLPGYRLIERLGRGGFGEVWKAEAPGGFLKAIKFVFGDLDAADEDSRPAEQEKKALDRVKLIRHPYILSLEQVQIIEGQLIIVMELADRNLWDRFRECRTQGLGGVPREELLRYMEEAAEALDLMNNHYQIQHLDIKPQNLFLVFSHIKVADFGLAKMFEGGRGTITGGVTPVYAAPETFEGWVSRFTDQYSLAIVFQELLTGTRPFTGANTRQLLMQHINGSPDLSHLPARDQPIIGRALSKKPDDRWATCAEMVRALKFQESPPSLTMTPMPSLPGGRATLPVAQTPSGPKPSMESPTARNVPRYPTGTEQTSPTVGPMRALRAESNPAVGTPLPALVTASQNGFMSPRLINPATAAHATSALTLPQGRPAGAPTHRVAPPEEAGDGALFPALIIGLGQTGRTVIQQLKRVISDRYGLPEAVPHLRFLYIDTDPEAGSAINPDNDGNPGLAAREVILTRLNRPAHYLQHSHLPSVESWMPAGSLYKLPRNPAGTDGVRAFGRLALLDHYRHLSQRLKLEIETFLADETLAAADKATELGLRSNRPRAYVIAGLNGGTAGMVVDLAFLLRHEFRQVGYLKPEVVGTFFLPPANAKGAKPAVFGNTYAALTELLYFQTHKNRYQMTFDKSEEPVCDTDAPFARLAMLELPTSGPSKARLAVTGQAARALFHELLTPAGRVIDEVRDVYRNAYPTSVPTCQSFGMFRLSWPRAEVLVSSTHRFAQRLLQRWTAKDSAHLQESIAQWLQQQWEGRKLAFATMTGLFQKAARDSLREDPDRVFDAFVDPLQSRTPSSKMIDAPAVCGVLDQLLKLVGKPEADNDSPPGVLMPAMLATFGSVAKDAERELAFMAVQFIEQPQFRLAGAEETVRQISDRLKFQIETLEPMRVELDKEVRSQYNKLIQLIGALNHTGGISGMINWKSSVADLFDLLRYYPRKRLQLHVLDMALAVYRKLQGSTPEILREINFCRSTLNDLHAGMAKSLPNRLPIGEGKLVLPVGCTDLEQAADLFLASLSPEDLLTFDQALQKETQKKFRGLATVCLKPNDKAPAFREQLLLRAREFLDSRLDRADPAGVFLRSHPDQSTGGTLIAEAFDESAPDITDRSGKAAQELCVLALPPGENGERLREMVIQTVGEIDYTLAPMPDDIVVYREIPALELSSLPQLGNVGRDAYKSMKTGDHPPHTRIDVTWNS